MNNLYVFGIGGTGERVLKALTFLLGTGIKINVSKIIPIIIDPDQAGGDNTAVVQIMRNYKTLYDDIKHPSQDINFFSTEITPLQFGYTMSLGGATNVSFASYMSFASLNNSDQALVNMLYSQDNQNMDMTIGFKGNPNVGSTVLNQFSQSKDFMTFANDFTTGDGIFIISSIFGGTGASGFPLLLKNLRAAQNIKPTLNSAAALANAPIGAVSVLPYFKLSTDDRKNTIDSNTFISKTKAALTYYEKNLNNLTTMYYIGEQPQTTYNNVDGGAGQNNKSHFIELASALAIVDFAKNPGNNNKTIYKEFGIDSNKSDSISLGDLSPATQNTMEAPLVQFTLFCEFMKNRLQFDIDSKQNWLTDNLIEFLRSNEKNTLDSYVNSFLDWLSEMGQNKQEFDPFNLPCKKDDVFHFVKGIEPKKVFSTKSNYDLITDRLIKVSNKDIKGQKEKSLGEFLNVMNKGINRIVEEKLNIK